MAENILVVNFKVESEAYQALSEIRQASVNPAFIVSQACIVKNECGRIVMKDHFDTGVETTDDTRHGGLIGGLVGVIGGPIGMLLGGGMGALIGSAIDSSDAAKNASLIEKVCEAIPAESTAVIELVSELEPLAADLCFAKYESVLVRLDAAEIAEEIEEAERLQKQMEKDARAKLREEKKEARRQRVEEKRAKMKADFDDFKAKFKKKD